MTAINADWTPFFRELHSQRQQAELAGWRLPVWLALPLSEAAQVISLLWAEIPQQQRVFWLGATVPSKGPNMTLVRQKSQLLGSECDVLIIDAFDGLDWDLLAASAGTVKAGGLWLLLTPPEHQWQTWPNPAAKRWLS
jgi:tRNA(Met) cytidine acetyltransferase